ncbi:Camelysin metallo-endopeptidase [Blastococcus aurantiacus]|uniref:Camelysin metallo-endopeptidase n=1 Tax=Blastococcus aurantiacus TaxID=1550231 RepID=A0A1G7J323_9ACTN|nr:TasA family protein [Blastococcus aurantiacus]SDF18909.1 Camelysin metallo-endopeptidase [Blastococcus aurantiacus]
MSAKVTSSTTRKVVGSLGVIGAAAAVAGMGTFGSFTDSTTPVATTINSGTVSIDLTKASTLEFSAAELIPGDSVTRTFTLKNDGSSDLGSIMLASAATTSSILTTDATNGLQLSVKSCPVAWTQSGNSFTCASGEKTLLASGPAVNNKVLDAPASLGAGKSDNLAISYALPVSAGNEFQGKQAAFSLTFTATQRTAPAAR